MAKYLVPVAWEMYGHVTVEATTEEEAIDIALAHQDEYPLPANAEYVMGSFEVDTQGLVIEVKGAKHGTV